MLPQIELSRVSLPYASGAGAIDEYAVANLRPELVAAFADSYYRASSSLTTFDGLITHSAASNATMVDSDGLLKWRPHNIVLNSATPATQSITVISGADYTVECTGVSIALSGAGTGTVTEGNPATITASTTTLTLTVTGSTGTMWAYRSDLGGMVNNPDTGNSYVPTTSSARYLPRRGHHVYNGTAWVNEGLLHESEARTNLLVQSQDMANAAWTTSSTNVTTTSVGNNTFNVVPSATNTQHRTSFDEDVAVSAGTYTLSVEAKANGYDYLGLTLYDGSYDAIVVSLVDGTVFQVQGTSTYTVQDVGNGFWRVSLTGVLTADLTDAARASGFWPKPDASTAASTAYLADGTSGVLLRYPQFEAASTPSSYIPTSGSTVNRTPDILTIPSANLPWPTPKVIGPELVTNGTFDTDVSGWSAVGATVTWESGELKTVSASGGEGTQQQPGFEIGKVYQATADLRTLAGAAVSLRVVNVTNTGFVAIGEEVTSSSPTSVSVIWKCAQVGEYIYIRNNNAGTAYADNISVREIDPLAVSIQMDGRVTYADTGVDLEGQPFRWHIDTSNRIDARLTTTGSITGQINFRQSSSGTTYTVSSGLGAYSPGTLVPYNIASRHGSTFINGAVDGTALTADTTPVALPDLSATNLQIAYAYMGTISLLRIWADDLGDTGIAEASA